MFLSGNEAVARGAYEAGLHTAAAYPGTPSTEILEALATYGEIDAQWSVNEKVAYEVALGASWGGARSLYASKHVGLNVAMDPLMTSAYTGVNGGFVVVVADDPGMHSSQNEQDTRWVGIYGKLPIFEPSSPQEAHDFVKDAFAFSEQFDTPVLVRLTTRVSHTKEDVLVSERVEAAKKEFAVDIAKYVMVPGNAMRRHAVLEDRMASMKKWAETAACNRIERGSSGLGFITGGVPYNYVKEQYPEASILKLGVMYPFCDDRIRDFAKSVDKLVVVEELDPFLEEHIKTLGIPFTAKDPSFRINELRPEFIPAVVKGEGKGNLAGATRKPQLCQGCPHGFVFDTLKEVGATVAGDIGCYTLGALPPRSSLHTCLCMGGGVTVHEGLRRGMQNGKIVGVVGDSTFVHSGVTGLINAVYNGVKGLIIILDNSTTAMTGGQNHPATGLTITNQPTARLVLEDLCKACGADYVDVVKPNARAELKALIEKRLEEDALSIIIARSPCILTLKKSKQASA